MRRNRNKYVVYVNEEYVKMVCGQSGIVTKEETEKLRQQIFDKVKDFIHRPCSAGLLMSDIFRDDNGEFTKAIEIYRLADMARIKTLSDLRRLIYNKKRRHNVASLQIRCH